MPPIKAVKPKTSYTIWLSQRTGSTLLYKGLEATGIAGNPGEWIIFKDPDTFTMKDIQDMWQNGSTSNGVFGMKTSTDKLDGWIQAFRRELQLSDELNRPMVWEKTYPGCKHIFMTRRNKVRLAVSWWRAIVSGEWHRAHSFTFIGSHSR